MVKISTMSQKTCVQGSAEGRGYGCLRALVWQRPAVLCSRAASLNITVVTVHVCTQAKVLFIASTYLLSGLRHAGLQHGIHIVLHSIPPGGTHCHVRYQQDSAGGLDQSFSGGAGPRRNPCQLRRSRSTLVADGLTQDMGPCDQSCL